MKFHWFLEHERSKKDENQVDNEVCWVGLNCECKDILIHIFLQQHHSSVSTDDHGDDEK